jgi:predicted transposase/invertase (TIGR01784 family)
LFGASKAFVQQLEVGQAYETLCPVYGVAIVNETFEKNMEDWFHHYQLTNVKDLDKSLEGLELIFIELQKFRPQTFEHRKIGALWLRFLKEANETLLSIPQEFQDNPDLAMAVELAQESAYTPMELELYDQYLDAIRVEQTVRADSYGEGRAEGEQIGLEKGEQIGLQKGKQIWGDKKAQEIAKELIVAGIPMETVSKTTKLSLDVVAELAREISRE